MQQNRSLEQRFSMSMPATQSSGQRRIVIFGAAGGIGRQCLNHALERGMEVLAIVRSPLKLNITHPNLEIEKGDATDINSFAVKLRANDIIISAIGTGSGLFDDKPTQLYSKAADNIIRAMKISEVTRAYFISASGLEVSPLMPLPVRIFTKYALQKLLRFMYADLRTMETIVKASEIRWTIVRPPQLTDKSAKGVYRVAINSFLKNGLKLSRADVAHYIVNNLDNEDCYKAVVEVAY